MGNCVFKPFGKAIETIKVATPNGIIMELSPPITAMCITKKFPDMAIYHTLLTTSTKSNHYFKTKSSKQASSTNYLPLNNNDLASTSSFPYQMFKKTDTKESATPKV
ncbi:hypothetical protein J1N35_013645 [Gossypium stocksii]|uniref:Uncharacterized protein n=1 Tax=Gossypium stocksii TaxID=47602 RepID=A0A9D4A8K1_9ROSI|nr:hypothetical protein J1N35_013645 [Gossypium stocksii]